MCSGEEGFREQGPKAVQRFSGRGGSEIGGNPGERGREYVQMIPEIGPGRQGQRRALVQHWEVMPPMASVTVHCTILRAHCAPGLGLSQGGASCYAWSTDTACAGTVSGEEGVLASRHPWASGAYGPSLRAVGATKDLMQSQAMVKCSWVKHGLERGLRVQDQGGEGVMEVADTSETKKSPPAPKPALWPGDGRFQSRRRRRFL